MIFIYRGVILLSKDALLASIRSSVKLQIKQRNLCQIDKETIAIKSHNNI